MEQGLLVVVSGPAGSGKGTVLKELKDSGDFVFSVSATTRAPRPGELDGVKAKIFLNLNIISPVVIIRLSKKIIHIWLI